MLKINIKHGIVKKIEKNSVFIFTSDNELVKVKINDKEPSIDEEYSGEQIFINDEKKYSKFLKVLITLIIIITLYFVATTVHTYVTPVTSISANLNCSVFLKCNKWDMVISSYSLDSNGSKLLQGVSLKNKTVARALLLLFQEAKKQNYINNAFVKDNKNISILINTEKIFLDLTIFEQQIKNDKFNVQISKNGHNLLNFSSKK